MVFTWDSAFEAAPANNVSRSLIDNYIRDTKRAIRERMEVEHEWGPSSSIDSGRHIGGRTTVMGKGDAAAMAAVATPQDGALFLLTDGAELRLHVYYSGDWHVMSTLNHLFLSNRDVDPTGSPAADAHPALIKQAAVNALTGPLNMQGNFLKSTTNALALTQDSTLGYVKHKHVTETNPHRADSANAFTPNSILLRSLKLSQSSTVYNIAHNAVQDIIQPVTLPSICFFPQVYAYLGSPTYDVRFCAASSGDFGIINETGGAIDVRVRWESWVI